MSDQPSTSNAAQANSEENRLEIVEDERLNESLESYAKAYNLSALNVKNIIYHVIKNPETFPTLIGKEGEALWSWRLTRSRWKEIERMSSLKFDLEMKPLHKPKTFLDVDYGDEDEDDADYQPETEEPQDEEAAASDDQDEEEMELQNGEPTNEDFFGDEIVNFEDDGQLLTSVDDPDYLNFVTSCLTPNPHLQLPDDDDDEYAPVINEMDIVEEDEYRMDRSTKIPRWEVDALLEDLYQEDDFHNLLASPPPPSRAVFNSSTDQQPEKSALPSDETSSKEAVPEPLLLVEIPGCLFNENPQFTDEELQVLKVQLEKHVQLLTQTVVGSHGHPSLVRCHNTALKMIHELDEKMYQNDHQDSLYKIRNLPDAIASCHDIQNITKVDLPIPRPLAKKSQTWPSNEIQWVLSQSKAIRYPELLPERRFNVGSSSVSAFLVSEQLLLALALYELKHVKHSTWNNWSGKYALISSHFLPNKTVNQIKVHLRNLRGSQSQHKLPVQQILLQAEKGTLIAEFRLDHGESARDELPVNWPEEVQPAWLKNLSNMVRQGHVVTGSPLKLMHETSLQEFIILPANSNTSFLVPVTSVSGLPTNFEHLSKVDETILNDEMMCMPSTSNAVQEIEIDLTNEQDGEIIEPEEIEIMDETSNDRIFSNEVEDEAETDPSKQKAKRKIDKRRERGLKGLSDTEYKEQVWKAMVSAVEKDVRQRFFMHQEKLRELQRILSSKDLSPKEMFEQLNEKLKDTHSHVIVLLSTLLKPEDLPDWASADRRRAAYMRAMEMIVNIQAYVAHARNSIAAKCIFQKLKNDQSITEEELRAKLYKFFGKDEPLWRLIRENILANERFQEKVEDWEYEYVDLDALKDDQAVDKACQYENVEIPYSKESDDRSLLQLRQGRMTMEHGGRLKTVHVSFASEHGQTQTAAPWTKEDDRTLLTNYNLYEGDAQKAVEAFIDGKKTASGLEASRRLSYLLSLIQKV